MGGNRGELARRRAGARATAKRREGRWAILMLVVAVLLVAVAVIRGGGQGSIRPLSLPTGSLPTGSLEPEAEKPEPAPDPLEDNTPRSGPGTFIFDGTNGPVLGGARPTKRSRLAGESIVDG